MSSEPYANTGRTQWMIDQLIEAVRDGQPQSIVVGHTQDAAMKLRLRVAEALDRAGIKNEFTVFNSIDADGCIIAFFSAAEAPTQRRFAIGVGEFWDHHCAEQPEEVAAWETRIIRQRSLNERFVRQPTV